MANRNDPLLIDRDHPLQLPPGWPRPPYIVLPASKGNIIDFKPADDRGELVKLLTRFGGVPLKHTGGGLYHVMDKSEIVS